MRNRAPAARCHQTSEMAHDDTTPHNIYPERLCASRVSPTFGLHRAPPRQRHSRPIAIFRPESWYALRIPPFLTSNIFSCTSRMDDQGTQPASQMWRLKSSAAHFVRYYNRPSNNSDTYISSSRRSAKGGVAKETKTNS
jgi:hypothetical protein